MLFAPRSTAADVLGGFLMSGDMAHGRPVGVLTDNQGTILVADDLGNAVWRLSGKDEAANGSAR